jgi:SAM-dependent methyltransferase
MLPDDQDVFGHEILDHFNGIDSFEIIERDDGLFSVSPGPKVYFSEHEEWAEIDKRAMEFVRGKVLDIGCGAGRHALYLQGLGLDVLGIDNSPGAIKVCRERGLLRAEVLSITQVSRRLGTFDSILMMGNNFGLMGNPKRARWLFRKFSGITNENARIIAQTGDVTQSDVPEHVAYHALNRARGRLPGQLRFRIRYKKLVTKWFDWLMMSEGELRELLEGLEWRICETIKGEEGRYTAIIEKS